MKKLLGIVVLSLLWCNVGISGENKFTVKELNINLPSEYELEEIGKFKGTFIDGFPYGGTFYAQTKDGKLVSLLETFFAYAGGNHTTHFLTWAKTILYKLDPKSGCNESSSKQYLQVLDKGAGGIHCVSVKILNNKEIYSPDLAKVLAAHMGPRTMIPKNFIEQNNLEVPDQMLRSEHFFWSRQTLIWVFITDLTSDNLTEEQINNFIIDNVDMHKGFENDLKMKSKIKIDFPEFQRAEDNEAKAEAEAKAKAKAKTKTKTEEEEIAEAIAEGIAEAEAEIKAEAEAEAKAKAKTKAEKKKSK